MSKLAAALQAPFAETDIEWRVQQAKMGFNGPEVTVLAYVTNRAIMSRLDEVFGPFGWQNEYKAGPAGGIICGISARDENGEWVQKWDGSDNTQIEATKGGLSDSMKRAGYQWGIGRYLYDLPEGIARVASGYDNVNKKRNAKIDNKWYKWQPPGLPSWALPKK